MEEDLASVAPVSKSASSFFLVAEASLSACWFCDFLSLIGTTYLRLANVVMPEVCPVSEASAPVPPAPPYIGWFANDSFMGF